MLYEKAIQFLEQNCLFIEEKIHINDHVKVAEIIAINGMFSKEQTNLADEFTILYHNGKVTSVFTSLDGKDLNGMYIVEYASGERALKFRKEIMERVILNES